MGNILTRWSTAGVLFGGSLYGLYRVLQRNRNIDEIHVQGDVDPQFAKVKQAFRQNFIDGWETQGAAIAVFYEGRLVVDLWGGYADYDAFSLWQSETMATIFSCTKIFSALSIAVLVDRGLLKYNAPVGHYWPEFVKHGKGDITVEMLISHTAGLAILDRDISYDEAQDWRRIGQILEEQRPNWIPGTAFGYHAFTIGWLADQLVRRVDPNNRSVAQFAKEELCAPFSDEIVHIGLPRELDEKVARIRRAPIWHYALHCTHSWTYTRQVIGMLFGVDQKLTRLYSVPHFAVGHITKGRYRFNDPAVRRIELPSVNGISTARALAAPLNALVNGQLLSEKTMEILCEPTIVDGIDCINGEQLDVGHGFNYTKNCKDDSWLCGHTGHGGQNVKCDWKHKLAFAYITNDTKPSLSRDMTRTFVRLQDSIYDCIF